MKSKSVKTGQISPIKTAKIKNCNIKLHLAHLNLFICLKWKSYGTENNFDVKEVVSKKESDMNQNHKHIVKRKRVGLRAKGTK